MLTISRIHRNIRSLRRYRDVLGILIKYGFGHIVEQLNLTYYLQLGRRVISLGKASKEVERLSPAERLRLAVEELGPTFIKLGQVLSTRPDILPRDYLVEFGKLQDQVPSHPYEEIAAQIVRELGSPVEEVYAEFSPIPIAAASMAQVHVARLKTGEDVVVKVLRPGVERIIGTDLDILMGLAYLIEHHVPLLESLHPVDIVKEFRRTITREMNFAREGHTIDRFAANFAGNPNVVIPKVFWECSGETVLTMQRVTGVKVSDIGELEARGHDPKELAQRGADFFLQQVLVHGLFHGDPHPGNFFVNDDGAFCLIDFGMVGRLDDNLKIRLVDLLTAFLQRNAEKIIAQLIYSGDLPEEGDIKALRRDLTEFIDDYYDIPLQDIRVGKLLGEFFELLTSYRIRFPSDLMLLTKALVTIEGVGRQLDPDFNMVGHLKPFMERTLRERYAPSGILLETGEVLQAYGNLLKTLPKDIRQFVNRLNRNKFKIDLEHRGLGQLISDLDKSSNRISFSLIIAALIVGSSIVMQTEKGPLLFGFPLLGLLGYSIAAFLGLWLAIAILRSGRM